MIEWMNEYVYGVNKWIQGGMNKWMNKMGKYVKE